MSSLQTMTAPAVGHNRPPDPGIDIASSSTTRTNDAIVDHKSDDLSRHDFRDPDVNANAGTDRNTNVASRDREEPMNTDVASSKQNGSALHDRSPAEANSEEKLDTVADNGRDGNERKETQEEQRQIKEEKQEAQLEEQPAEKETSTKDVSDMTTVKEDPTDKHNQLPLQDQEKQSAATSLLAQLLGSLSAQTGPSPATPEYLPRTPLPEPLTDASTPAAPNEDISLPVINGQTEEVGTQPGTDGQAVTKQEDKLTEVQDHPVSPTDKPFNDMQIDTAATRIPDMVTGVMEDPLSKTSHDHSALFAPFDADGSIKNGLDSLQQHDLFANAFLSHEINMSGLPDVSYSQYDVATSIAGSEPRIQAFAKLEFDDGHFYVNTYSFILGRDVRAARAAFQREVQARQAMRPSRNKSSSGGNTSHTPNRVKRDGSAYVGSVVSDRGGIMGFDPDVPHHISQISRRSSVSSQPDSVLHATPAQLQTNHTDYNALAMQSLYDGNADAKPVDMLALLPSPDACPTIPIHPPATADGSSAGHKGISRKHVKIAYNFDKNFFEMEVMGRNGAFIGADWLAPGQVRPLHSGDYIQIGGVRIRFLLPDVPIGETGADRLEEPLPEGDGTATARETTEVTGEVDAMEEDSDESQEGTSKPRVTKLILKTKSQADSANADASADANGESSQPKRRGPGRPPKDGIMSKRERAEIAREQKLAAKREANGGVTPPPPVNRPKLPTKQPRKEDSVEEVAAAVTPATPAKPAAEKKSVKRKQPDGSVVDVPVESIEGDEQPQIVPEQQPPQPVVEYAKPPPPKKRKPSRSPSPDYPPESAYTPDQLQKPPYNYAVLIFDALTESRTPMTLKQIYRALKLKYPYFRFKCETEGWTSSVRHNLNGNRQLFEHAERDGKGASVEKEKKRRPSPPPPASHIHHPPQHYMPPPNHTYPNQSLQNQQFQFSAIPPNTFNAPAPQPSTYQRPAPPPPAQTSAPNPFKNISLPPALTQQAPAKYVSPYPCALPPEILQLQQESQPKPAMDQRQSGSVTPHPHQPMLHQSQPPPPQHQPQHQTQPQHNQPHQPQQHPPPQYTPNGPSYPPPANSQIHHYPPPPGQGPPPSPSQQPPQPYQPQPQPPQQHQLYQPPPGGPPLTDNNNVNNKNNVSGNSTTNTIPEESSLSFLERANKAIDDFEAVLMEDYDDKNYIREVLKSARARALGHADKSSFADGEPKDEAVLLDVLRNLIGSLKDE
ncbi:forkhead domain protein [Talaromyces stipitatus ATCC 10500]|uniref:Forkhead domain protein n=1 Tax=Talaromyces stipitatus (strain ATCC 10500 / CBS 375.48 / QM 6759 / NRRL 1006) TaxID=441959 RepID=B8LUQ2_TALSN|nr:forkhead domain protein [Talaromyces stipitatus ATCC 10500]EED23909.1 forkhead domain protein [Talaromyces stipitatus ATCC 10500]